VEEIWIVEYHFKLSSVSILSDTDTDSLCQKTVGRCDLNEM